MDKIHKASLLTDMKRHPCRYSRETMYEYITSGELTYNDLVSDGTILTDSAYSHILKYPRLRDEQRPLPLIRLDNHCSRDGNLDVLLFGTQGVGKRMFLSGLLSLSGQFGFGFDHSQQCGAYAIELRNYSELSFIPPSYVNSFIPVIEAFFTNDRGQESPISLIEMPDNSLANLCREESPKFADLGPGAEGILFNNNRKIAFLFIDSKELCDMYHNDKNYITNIRNCDVLSKLISLFESYPSFLKKVESIHIVLTKSDLWYDNWNADMVQDKLEEFGYSSVIETLKILCHEYEININTGHQVGIFPFSIGKFLPGDLYEFDETDSLKLLRLIEKHVIFPPYISTWKDKLIEWFNK